MSCQDLSWQIRAEGRKHCRSRIWRLRCLARPCRVHGSYGLRSEAIAFAGTLRMDATISEAAGVGGLKGFLLKAVDPIFRKKGAGALVPIKVGGTREKPAFGLDVGRVFKQ